MTTRDRARSAAGTSRTAPTDDTATGLATTEHHELVLTRLFRAPRALVFRAWTEPAQLARWWGPHGYTCPDATVDLRPGGRYRIVTRGAEGADYPVTGVFHEVDVPERIVYTETWDDMPAEWLAVLNEQRGAPRTARFSSVVTVEFEDRHGATHVTLTIRFGSMADRDAIMRMNAATGWSQSFEKLDGVVETHSSAHDVVIARVLEFPREAVFDAWTDPAQLAAWWGPEGFTSTFHEIDVRPGGVWRFTMRAPDGTDYPNKIVFREVQRPRRLTYSHSSDTARPDSPLGGHADDRVFDATVTFEAVGEHTRVTSKLAFGSTESRDRMVESGAIEGGYSSLSRLAGYLDG